MQYFVLKGEEVVGKGIKNEKIKSGKIKSEKIKSEEIKNLSYTNKNSKISIVYIRLFICTFAILTLIIIKRNNSDLYKKVKDIYINNNAEIIDGKALIYEFSSWSSASLEFLKTCTLEIFRSVTS